MVNLGGGPAFILGLFLAIAGAGLFFLRSVRPELARDYDIFFAAVGLLCGIILIFNGWRLDPILQFSQFLLTGTAVFFAFESVRMRGAATEQARRSTATVDRDRPVSRSRVYTEAELDKIDPYDNVYEGAEPNYSSPRLRGYDDPAPRTSRRPPNRTRTAPPEDLRNEPRRRNPRNRPETRDSVVREPQGDYPTGSPRDYPPSSPRDRYGNEETNSRPRRCPVSARDAYDEWDDVPKPSSRPRRSRTAADSSYGERNSSSVRESYSPPAEPRPRKNPADLGRSYEPEEDYPGDDIGSSYNDSGLGRNYDEEKPIPGDYVVDYQPLENMGTDYADDGYDDSDPNDPNDYNDYDDSENNDSEPDDYDDYKEPPGGRKPINFGNDYD